MLTSNDREIEGDSGKKGSLKSSDSSSVWTKKFNSKIKIQNLQKYLLPKMYSILFDNTLNLTKSEQAARDEIIQNISNGLLSLFEIFDNEIFILGGTMSSEPFDLIELLENI